MTTEQIKFVLDNLDKYNLTGSNLTNFIGHLKLLDLNAIDAELRSKVEAFLKENTEEDDFNFDVNEEETVENEVNNQETIQNEPIAEPDITITENTFVSDEGITEAKPISFDEPVSEVVNEPFIEETVSAEPTTEVTTPIAEEVKEEPKKSNFMFLLYILVAGVVVGVAIWLIFFNKPTEQNETPKEPEQPDAVEDPNLNATLTCTLPTTMLTGIEQANGNLEIIFNNAKATTATYNYVYTGFDYNTYYTLLNARLMNAQAVGATGQVNITEPLLETEGGVNAIIDYQLAQLSPDLNLGFSIANDYANTKIELEGLGYICW